MEVFRNKQNTNEIRNVEGDRRMKPDCELVSYIDFLHFKYTNKFISMPCESSHIDA